MRLGPFEINRRVLAAEQKRAPRELGASGVVSLDGFLTPLEYLRDLTGAEGLRTFRRMQFSDASVQEALGHVFAPILNANWTIEAASEEPEDLEIAEATRRAYFDWPLRDWQEHLDEALEYLVYGHYLFEIVWQVVEDELEFEDPATLPKPDPSDPNGKRLKREKTLVSKRQFLTFESFAPRLPESIYKWNEERGRLASVTQQVFREGNYEEIELPAEDLLLFTHKRRGSDYTGRSILRGAYKAWLMKEIIEKTATVAVERYGVGVPVGYLPQDRANDDGAIDRMEAILQNVRSGQYTYIVVPGPKAQGSGDQSMNGYTIEILTPSGTIPDFTPILEYHRGEIKGAVLARFAELGHGSTGARATSDVQSEVWYDALHSLARQVEGVHAHAIRRFVDANYETSRYPKLAATNIEGRNLAEFAEAVSRTVSSGALKADKPLRAAVREAMDFPPEDEVVEEEEEPDPDEPELQPGEKPTKPKPAQASLFQT